MWRLKKLSKIASSRRQINIKGVQDGVLVLPGNRFRAILQVSSVNFELKSESEKDSLIDLYEGFLNSINFGLQFVVRVREVDIDKYLANLDELMCRENTLVYKTLIIDYARFLKDMIRDNKILERNFYVVISLKDTSNIGVEAANEQLKLQCDIVARGLNRLGIKSMRLSSLEVLDLFYSFYNPQKAKLQPLYDQIIASLHSSYIRRDINA